MKIYTRFRSRPSVKIFWVNSIILTLFTAQMIQGSTADQTRYQFLKPALTFEKFKGLEFRVSEPYSLSQGQGAETGYAIALEFKNKSADDVTSMTIKVKLFDNQGKIVKESMSSCGPLTFIPATGKTLQPGYSGVYERFCSLDKVLLDTFVKIEIELIEIKTAPKGLYDKPVFEGEWKVFDGFPGLEFRLSGPFQYLDPLSGGTYFAIAIEFRNKTKKAVKFLNFNQKVYDDQGLLVDREVQNHNQMYEPFDYKTEKFPAGYSGINKTFYINDLSFYNKFKNIEYKLITVDY